MTTHPSPQRAKSLALLVREEIFNTLSHGIGAGLSLMALIWLVWQTAPEGHTGKLISAVVYGVSMLLLYSASTVYHGARNMRRKVFYNRLDHSAIYLLIAGTYTPFALLVMRGPLGWTIFGLEWALAIGGIVYKLFFYSRKYRRVSAFVYVVMGWLGMVGGHLIAANLAPMGIVWLVAGGLAYSAGVVFYLWERLPYAHGVFHLFILAGTVFHFMSVIGYVL